jgi:hypothetical protein
METDESVCGTCVADAFVCTDLAFERACFFWPLNL